MKKQRRAKAARRAKMERRQAERRQETAMRRAGIRQALLELQAQQQRERVELWEKLRAENKGRFVFRVRGGAQFCFNFGQQVETNELGVHRKALEVTWTNPGEEPQVIVSPGAAGDPKSSGG